MQGVTALSAQHGAGLYLLRRARTLAAPHQLRLVATAVLAVLIVDLGRITLSRLGSTESVPLPQVGAEALSYLALAVLLWRSRAGLLLAAAAVASGWAAGGTGLEPLMLAIVGTACGLRRSPAHRMAFVLGLLGFVGGSVVLAPANGVFYVTWYLGSGLAGLGLGLLARTIDRHRTHGQRELAEAAAEDSRIRADERRVLARELHDVVTHHLANASLQLMSRGEVDDPENLHKTLNRVTHAVGSAQTELRLLVQVLRDDPATAAGGNEVGELAQRLAPTVAAAGWARRLVEAGFDPLIEIPGSADHLQFTVQNTVTRTIAVVCDNVLRHAPTGPCSLTVSINKTQVVVRAANPIAAPPTGCAQLGWSLRELRERVDLTGGTFEAGLFPSAGEPESEWVLVVTVPRD